jgi:hypothetical protein
MFKYLIDDYALLYWCGPETNIAGLPGGPPPKKMRLGALTPPATYLSFCKSLVKKYPPLRDVVERKIFDPNQVVQSMEWRFTSYCDPVLLTEPYT